MNTSVRRCGPRFPGLSAACDARRCTIDPVEHKDYIVVMLCVKFSKGGLGSRSGTAPPGIGWVGIVSGLCYTARGAERDLTYVGFFGQGRPLWNGPAGRRGRLIISSRGGTPPAARTLYSAAWRPRARGAPIMPATIVIGAQWGDEGKGKIVDHLAERAAAVVRYQGGNNAGHTVTIGDKVLKLHQVPSGITRPHVAAVLGHGMVINPPALVEELDMLEGEGFSTDNLHISANAHLVMPYHVLLDELEEKLRGDQSLGTTKRGIGPAYTDKFARRGLRVQDLLDRDRFAQGVGAALKRVNLELQRVFEAKAFTVEEIVAAYAPAAERLAP
ncbi:MAG: hypothetical protein FJZ90_00205, partial [Chloroflexi bacterium]|nr:hypothetical protein [Chloroflexota bacterium]